MTLRNGQVIWGVLFLSLILAAGCETSKAVAGGTARAGTGVAEGVSKDAEVFWQKVMQLDTWIKDNLW